MKQTLRAEHESRPPASAAASVPSGAGPALARVSLPFSLFLLGAGLLAIALGSDLVGLGSLADAAGASRKHLAWIGLAVLSLGAVWDLSLGRKQLRAWLGSLELDRPNLLKFAAVTVQLGLLVISIQQLQLENYSFYHTLAILTFFGFIVHHLLPRPYRLPFFSLLTLTSLVVVLGWTSSGWLLLIGLGLIGICHLPLPWAVRIGALLAVAGGLTAARAGFVAVPWSGALWPVLGSMFMFRLIIYVYDLKQRKAPASPARALSYFFMLPNVVFPLFPVVDYGTFCRTHYQRDSYAIYQKGLRWMLWGVVHLIFYRFVNYYLVIGPEQVTDTSTLVRYMVSNYLLIVRLSGQFHLVVGMLHLFGFDLPRIMDLYLLASSFTDFFRRVNIYWKDFIQKLVYNHAYLALRKWADAPRLVAATVFGFLVTWFLHGYQWFWIRGTYMVSAPDLIFWSMLGLLMVANAVYEARYGRRRTLIQRAPSFRELLTRSLSSLGVFASISVLWSMWISPSLSDWLSLLFNAGVTLPSLLAALLAAYVVMFAAIALAEKLSTSDEGKATPGHRPVAFWRAAAATAVPACLLVAIATPAVHTRLGAGPRDLVQELRQAKLSGRDVDIMTRGYYEDLSAVDRFNLELWQIYMKRPTEWPPLRETKAGRFTGDFLRDELVPLASIQFHGAPLSTNRWGMRDRDYEKAKPAGTYRIALLGGSFVVGSGVADHETFESLLEERLNRENDGAKYRQLEILNFSVAGYSAFQQLLMTERKVLDFEPDALFYTATASGREEKNLLRHLIGGLREGVEIPYAYLIEVVKRAGVDRATPEAEAYKRLQPYSEQMLSWVYRRFGEMCRERGILPVLVYFPMLQKEENDPQEAASIMRLATEAGFSILDLSDLYDNQDGEALRVAEWDWHPNAKAQRLIAQRLYAALWEKRETIPLAFPTGPLKAHREPSPETDQR